MKPVPIKTLYVFPTSLTKPGTKLHQLILLNNSRTLENIMPIQAPQWTEYLSCPVCENAFELRSRLPISISSCGHTVCKACLSTLQRRQCPFDQVRNLRKTI